LIEGFICSASCTCELGVVSILNRFVSSAAKVFRKI